MSRIEAKLGLQKLVDPLVKAFLFFKISPNVITSIGLVLNIGVTVIFVQGAAVHQRGDLSFIGWAGVLILVAGLFDVFDGQVARLGNQHTQFGAFYDSVLDRYSELIMFFGVCYYLVTHHYFLSSIFTFCGLIGSVMVSYTRARAESLGVECHDGLMQRPERVILIGISAVATGLAGYGLGGNLKWSLFGSDYLVVETISIFTIPLAVLAVLSNATAIARVLDVKRKLNNN